MSESTRTTVSLSAAQVAWLSRVLELLRRGSDCSILMRIPDAPRVARLVESAKVRLTGTRLATLTATRTHCKHGHEFTADNTGTSSTGYRYCRQCSNMHHKARRTAYRVEHPPSRPAPARVSTHCRRGHELTRDNTYVSTIGGLRCRICRRQNNADYRTRLQAAAQEGQ